jgi:hypothetical protein
MTEGVYFGDEVAHVVVAGLPGAAVRVVHLCYQRGQVVIAVFDRAPERVGDPCAACFIVRNNSVNIRGRVIISPLPKTNLLKNTATNQEPTTFTNSLQRHALKI